MIQVETVAVPENAQAEESAPEESEPAAAVPVEALPEPPPAPDVPDSTPLPELPPEPEPEPEPREEAMVIPKPKPKSGPEPAPKRVEKPRPSAPLASRPVPAPVAAKPATAPVPRASVPSPASGNGKSKTPGSAGGTGGTSTKPVVGSLSFGVGEGRQPAPSYPATAKRNRQEGTVVVKMLVGTDGRVQSASAASPCAWAELNASAVSTVQNRWKFKSGPVRIYRVAITFRLR
jgi:protein TonB